MMDPFTREEKDRFIRDMFTIMEEDFPGQCTVEWLYDVVLRAQVIYLNVEHFSNYAITFSITDRELYSLGSWGTFANFLELKFRDAWAKLKAKVCEDVQPEAIR